MNKLIRNTTAMYFILASVVVKNLTVLFKVRGLNFTAKRLKANSMATNLDAQTGTFGVMSPTTTIVKGYVTAGNLIASQRADAILLVASLTKQEKENAALIVKTIRDNWLGTIKTKAAGSIPLINGVGADVKGLGTMPDKTRFARTWPEPIVIDQNVPMRLELELIGNDVLSKGKPYGAVSIGCYRQIGGAAPLRNNHPLAEMIPGFSKMNFKDTFITGQEGKVAYYIFFWLDKDGKKGPESPVFPYTITS